MLNYLIDGKVRYFRFEVVICFVVVYIVIDVEKKRKFYCNGFWKKKKVYLCNECGKFVWGI